MTRGGVLLLGAGRVAGPAIRHLVARGLPLTVACCDPERASALLDAARSRAPRSSRAEVVRWMAGDDSALEQLLQRVDVAISLLPPSLHASVAARCVAVGVHLVTTSYISAAVRALDDAARARGVVLLNEIGLDPGLDHVYALRLIDEARARGEEIVAFRSICGGLPAERDANPWGYKLSWSPLGVLRAAREPARYREHGRVVELAAERLFAGARRVTVGSLGTFEAIANRDATRYEGLYGLQGIPTLFRGTLRYPGWAETMAALAGLDLLSETAPGARTWAELLAARLPGEGALTERARRALPEAVVSRLEWLGLFEEAPLGGPSPIEALAERMEKRLSYGAGERDLVVLRNEVETADRRGHVRQVTAELIVRGDADGESAMARTVGLPAAIAAELLLRGELAESLPGVRLPTERSLYRPLAVELEQLGIAPEVRSALAKAPR